MTEIQIKIQKTDWVSISFWICVFEEWSQANDCHKLCAINVQSIKATKFKQNKFKIKAKGIEKNNWFQFAIKLKWNQWQNKNDKGDNLHPHRIRDGFAAVRLIDVAVVIVAVVAVVGGCVRGESEEQLLPIAWRWLLELWLPVGDLFHLRAALLCAVAALPLGKQ